MHARAKLLGHPIHQMLIPLPLGLLSGVVIFDIVHLITGNGHWAEIAYWLIVPGVISGLLAAVFGLIDWTAIPRHTRAHRVGLIHAGGNVVVLVLYVLSWLLRRDAPAAPGVPELVLSFAGFALAGVTGWLGGELVDRMGVGVDDGAHLDAPNSLSGKPASDRG